MSKWKEFEVIAKITVVAWNKKDALTCVHEWMPDTKGLVYSWFLDDSMTVQKEEGYINE